MQFGFMFERGTIDDVFILRRSCSSACSLYMCLVDLEKTFDLVPCKVCSGQCGKMDYSKFWQDK